MVPISSVRISRVLTYSGSRSLSQSFVYGDFTLFVLPFQVIRLLILMLSRGPYPEYITTSGLGFSDFARHYSRSLGWFPFLQVLRCFSSLRSLQYPIDSDIDTDYSVGFPIRRSADQCLFTAPHGFSQCITSFFASDCQGIHQMPLPIAWFLTYK